MCLFFSFFFLFYTSFFYKFPLILPRTLEKLVVNDIKSFFWYNNRFPLTPSSALSRGSRMSVKLWRGKVSHREISEQNRVAEGWDVLDSHLQRLSFLSFGFFSSSPSFSSSTFLFLLFFLPLVHHLPRVKVGCKARLM